MFQNVERLATLYEHPDDVDLTVGGSLETIIPGTLAGPTFLCILTEQFYRTRVGDRFWFENSGETGKDGQLWIKITDCMGIFFAQASLNSSWPRSGSPQLPG